MFESTLSNEAVCFRAEPFNTDPKVNKLIVKWKGYLKGNAVLLIVNLFNTQ